MSGCEVHPGANLVRRAVRDDEGRDTGKWYESCEECEHERDKMFRELFGEPVPFDPFRTRSKP